MQKIYETNRVLGYEYYPVQIYPSTFYNHGYQVREGQEYYPMAIYPLAEYIDGGQGCGGF